MTHYSIGGTRAFLNLAKSSSCQTAELVTGAMPAYDQNMVLGRSAPKYHSNKSIPSMGKLLEANGLDGNVPPFIGKSTAAPARAGYSDSDVYKVEWRPPLCFAIGERSRARARGQKIAKEVVAAQQTEADTEHLFGTATTAANEWSRRLRSWATSFTNMGHFRHGGTAYYRGYRRRT